MFECKNYPYFTEKATNHFDFCKISLKSLEIWIFSRHFKYHYWFTQIFKNKFIIEKCWKIRTPTRTFKPQITEKIRTFSLSQKKGVLIKKNCEQHLWRLLARPFVNRFQISKKFWKENLIAFNVHLTRTF